MILCDFIRCFQVSGKTKKTRRIYLHAGPGSFHRYTLGLHSCPWEKLEHCNVALGPGAGGGAGIPARCSVERAGEREEWDLRVTYDKLVVGVGASGRRGAAGWWPPRMGHHRGGNLAGQCAAREVVLESQGSASALKRQLAAQNGELAVEAATTKAELCILARGGTMVHFIAGQALEGWLVCVKATGKSRHGHDMGKGVATCVVWHRRGSPVGVVLVHA
jgi:hypothetical protein